MYMSVIRTDEFGPFSYADKIAEENVHRFIQKINNHKNRADSHILYRRDNNEICIYSDNELNERYLQEFGYYLVGARELGHLLDCIQNEDMLKVYVRTVPCIQRKRAGKRSIRCALNNNTDRLNWVEKKLNQIGVGVAKNEYGEKLVLEGKRITVDFAHSENQKNSGDYSCYAYEYTATVKVINAELFKNGVKNGIGPYKSYGCGLMLVGDV